MAGDQKIRAFIALKTPPGWDKRLRDIQEELSKPLSEAGKFRWVRPEQLHLTLRFLGHIVPAGVDKAQAAVIKAASQSQPFALRYTGLGCFPRPAAPRVLWAGIADPDERLKHLHAAITSATSDIGRAPEEREFRPHLTLARIENFDRRKGDLLTQLFEKYQNFITDEWVVREIILMRSHLSPQEARYEPILVRSLGMPE